MNLSEIKKLLIDVQIIVKEAIQELKAYSHEDLAKNTFSRTNKREMKAKVDLIMNQLICNKLNKTGISILSEEGNNASYKNTNSHYRFIVDPLDGTVNFVRGLGPSAISIALFNDNTPIFGVVGNISSQDIIWGGKDIGSYCNHDKINVSNNTILSESVLCSGFPSRFEINDNQKLNDYTYFMSQFGKVRMLGAASISLTYIARGFAEYYLEDNIMIWDVAAGLAIVEGAGGVISYNNASFKDSLIVQASNGLINLKKGYFK